MSLVASWRTALRVARREARRSKGRSALVVTMIALPVLALSFTAVSFDMLTLTGNERADRTMGTTDARMSWEFRAPILQFPDGENYWPVSIGAEGPIMIDERTATEAELLAKLPAGSSMHSLGRGTVELRTTDGLARPNAIAVDATTPVTLGYVEVLDGRAPRTATEVALTKQAMNRLGQRVGGTVTNADGTRSYTVVGEVEFPSLLAEVVLFAPLPEIRTALGLQQEWLVDTPTPVTWAKVRELNQSGIVVASRDVFLHPPPADEVPAFAAAGVSRELTVGVLIGGLALLEIVLLAGPAFAVSARRRQRQLALVAANGGTPAHVRRIVLADGIVLGLAGAVVGIAAGIATAFAARPFIEEYVAHARAGGYRVFPVALAAIALLALVTGLLAALVPAFITARQNVVASLAGRRGVTKSRKRWIVVGIAMVGAGTALVFAGTFSVSAEAMLAGIVVGELGLVFCTPALVGLVARIGRMLPLAPRVALRDAARNRASAAPAISAVMAAVAGSVALGLYFDSSRELQERQYHAEVPHGYAQAYLEQNVPGTDSPPVATASEVESVLRRTLPVSEVRTLSTVVCAVPDDPNRRCGLQPMLARGQECPYNQIVGVRGLTSAEQRAARADGRCDEYSLTWDIRSTVVDDGTALAALTGASAEEVAEATAVLRAGGVVVRDARFLDGGRVVFNIMTVTVTSDEKGTVVDGAKDTPVRVTFPAYLLTTGIPGSTIISPGAVAQAGLGSQTTAMIATTWRQPSVAEEDRLARQLAAIRTYGYVERGPRLETDARVWILMAASALITLSAAAIGTGLAAADGRADLSTLAAVGASPRLRRGLSLSQSGVIAGLGSLLGALAGLGAAVAILIALNQRYVDVWPGPPLLPIAVPWLSLLMALVVVPFVAILGAGLFTRSRLPIERRI